MPIINTFGGDIPLQAGYYGGIAERMKQLEEAALYREKLQNDLQIAMMDIEAAKKKNWGATANNALASAYEKRIDKKKEKEASEVTSSGARKTNPNQTAWNLYQKNKGDMQSGGLGTYKPSTTQGYGYNHSGSAKKKPCSYSIPADYDTSKYI